jgi:hypothetical protein
VSTADLPPALEIVRQALLVQPAPVVGDIEARFPAHLEENLREVAASFDRQNRQVLASLTALNGGLDLLQAQLAGSADAPVEQLEIVRSALEGRMGDAADGVLGFEALISEGRLKELPRPVRSRLLKLLRRGLAMCERYEVGITQAHDRVLAMLIDADPESRQPVARASTGAEVLAFFDQLALEA